MAQSVDAALVTRLRNARSVLLLTDERLDGDTLGATLGLGHVLDALGNSVTRYAPRPIPHDFMFLPGATHIRTDDDVFLKKAYDLAIVCDCSDGAYVKTKLALLRHEPFLLSFDHHATNPHYGNINIVEPDAASTADVVYRFLMRNALPLPPDAAQCLLTGICTDTSLFSTSNTTTHALEAAVALAKHGAKLSTIVTHITRTRPVPLLRLWGRLLARLHRNTEFDAMTSVLTHKDWEECGRPDVELSALANFLNASLEEAETIVLLRETEDGGVKAGLRSRSRDVAALAAQYGGGGHRLAAGFKVPNAHLEEHAGVWRIVAQAT